MVKILFDSELAVEKGVNYALIHSALPQLYDALVDKKTGFALITAEDIYYLTALTIRQQAPVLNKMEEEGILVIERRGLPCRRYFKWIG